MKKPILTMLLVAAAYAEGPYQATGFKVGEVTDTTAIVWTRLTLKANTQPADSTHFDL